MSVRIQNLAKWVLAIHLGDLYKKWSYLHPYYLAIKIIKDHIYIYITKHMKNDYSKVFNV